MKRQFIVYQLYWQEDVTVGRTVACSMGKVGVVIQGTLSGRLFLVKHPDNISAWYYTDELEVI